MNNMILVEYENLMRARDARTRGDRLRFSSLVSDISKDISGEYRANLERKVERWVDVTRAVYWKKSRSVEYYIQAKMLYRDAFFEAVVMMARSICEMICYELLDTVPHPFGSREDIEHKNFRQLANYLRDNAHVLSPRAFELLNDLYDIGNTYVHPKSSQKPEEDSRICLLKLGEALWSVFGAKSEAHRPGVTLQSAYADFTEICSSYHFWLDGVSPMSSRTRPQTLLDVRAS